MSQKLKASVAVMFSVGPIGFFLMMEFVSNYYAYFLTDILKISAATVGTILILVRIIDAVSVPAAGIVVETVKRCWGRYSIWLWLAPPLTTLFVVFMFTRPNFSPVILIMFLGTMYVLTHLTVNLAEASQIALIPVLGKTDEDRVLLSCRRAQGMSAGQVIFGLIAMPMVIALGQGDEGRGFFFTVLIFGLLQMFGYWLAARVAQPFESDAPQNINRVGLNEMVSQIVENKQLLILLAAEICRWSANIVILNYAVYYFKYAAGNMLMVTPFFTSISIATLAGNFLGQLTANKLEKKKTYYLGMSFNFCMMLLAWFFAANQLSPSKWE
ncbi:MAG: hypothetical protein GX357_01715 [Firmicutes bacterium]|nr:hypothetical protein [Bacillota bacterium]